MRRSPGGLGPGFYFWIGVLPGTGATPASFLPYGIARQYSKNTDEFGKGEIGGIMSPQASATAAVIMAGLFPWGLTPSALLFIEQKDFVWGLIGGIYIGSVLAFVLCVLATPFLAMIMRVPYAIITPLIIMISIVGSYTLNTSVTDSSTLMLIAIALLLLPVAQYVMRRRSRRASPSSAA